MRRLDDPSEDYGKQLHLGICSVRQQYRSCGLGQLSLEERPLQSVCWYSQNHSDVLYQRSLLYSHNPVPHGDPADPYSRGGRRQNVSQIGHLRYTNKYLHDLQLCSYWDFKLVPGQYSYVDAALEAGYSTFSWDRLGSGNSSKPDPYNTIQAPVELAVLIELTKLLRAGTVIAGTSAYKNVVHVGHSYGSDLSNYLVAVEPKLSDGIILTGYSNSFSYALPFFATIGHLASTNQPKRFAGYSSGYLTWADMYSAQFGFFAFPYFDVQVLRVTEQTKWPITVGQALTQGVLNASAPAFTGPVMVRIPPLLGRLQLRFAEG